MKRINLTSWRLLISTTLATLAILFNAEGQNPPATSKPPAGSNPGTPEKMVSAEKNSFNEVAAHLDSGGSFYVYLSLERWLAGLSAQVVAWRDMALALPDLAPADQANLKQAFEVASRLIKNSGIEAISGVGASTIALEKGWYQGKAILHHYPGKLDGYLWTLFGTAPHTMNGLDLLPPHTALASFWDLDLNGLWTALQKETSQPLMAEASAGLRKFAENFEQASGLKWEQLLASLGGEFGLFLTLNESNKVTVPLPTGSPLEIPEPGLVIVIKVKDDTLFNRLDQELKNNPQVISTDKDGARMRTLPLDLPLPIKARPTIARSGDYLLVAFTDDLMQEVLDLQRGKRDGLKSSAEFKKLLQGMPTKGNCYTYVSHTFGRTIGQIQAAILQARANNKDATGDLIQKIMNLNPPTDSLAVVANTQEGWFLTSHGGQDPNQALLVPAAAVAIPAGMLLPALSNAKSKAQSINCINNLKQIGLAARIYAIDHDDTLPPNFFAMKNELSTPKILICPSDNSRAKPQDFNWSEFTTEMISYEYLAPGIKDSADPQKVIFRCPIHGHVGLLDGSVRASRGSAQ
jgi:hypothetical protein